MGVSIGRASIVGKNLVNSHCVTCVVLTNSLYLRVSEGLVVLCKLVVFLDMASDILIVCWNFL